MDIYDFGLRLKQLRESRHLSQAEVARRIGVSRTSVSAYEQNIKMPKVETLERLALLYHASVDYILGLDNRRSFCLDEFTPEQQELIVDFLEKLKTHMITGE